MGGFAAVLKNGLWGYINEEGVEVIPFEYEEANFFVDDYAEVMKGGKKFFINKINEIVFENVIYDSGLYRIKKNGLWRIMDKKYEEISSYYQTMTPFLTDVKDYEYAIVVNNGLWGCINKRGEEFVPCRYDAIEYFIGGYAKVKKNDLYGIVNKDGLEILPCIYEEIGKMGHCYAEVIKKDGLWGFINEHYEIIIPCQYEEIHPFYGGLARVKKNGKWFFIDENGENPMKHIFWYLV